MTVAGRQDALKVAVIGGGPAGLGAALELAKLPFVDWRLYEKKSCISETGGGISLQPHTWRLLEHNGAAAHIHEEDFFRCRDGLIEQRRNGRSGQLILEKYHSSNVPQHHQSCRLVRAKLQSALLNDVEQARVHVSMKIVHMKRIPNRRIRLTFENGFVSDVDLVIGADGIRSSVRQSCLPEYRLSYKGQSVYRTIISKADVMELQDIPWSPVFWKHVSGLYVFTCPLGDDDFEVTVRIRRTPNDQSKVSWGQPFDLHTILHEFADFCEPVRQILRLAASGKTQEFALFAGPRLQSMIFHDNIALIGDASHALLGNFGAGAAFALEDVYTLARTLDWAHRGHKPLAHALELFDSIRSPHYRRLYEVVDDFSKVKEKLQAEDLPIDIEIEERIRRISLASQSWMMDYKIDEEVEDAIGRRYEQSTLGEPQSSSSGQFFMNTSRLVPQI